MTNQSQGAGIGAVFQRVRLALRQAGRAERAALAMIAISSLIGMSAAVAHLATLRWPAQPSREAIASGSPIASVAPDDLAVGDVRAPSSPDLPTLQAALVTVLRLSPPFDPVDSTRFRSGNQLIQLAEVEGPAMRAVCLDAEQQRWGCGRQARAALYNLIRENTVTCRGVPASPDGSGMPAFLARCDVSGLDLATELVRSGFARPLAPAASGRDTALAEARYGKRGLWNGDWTILP